MEPKGTMIYQSPYQDYAHFNGLTCQVLGKVSDVFDYFEIGIMYKIQFPDGQTIDACPEELKSL